MERFGKTRQILYASGTIGQSIADNIFGVYLIFFLMPPKESGMPELISGEVVFAGLTVLGLIIIFGRVIDSISDPLIAWLSDRARFAMGRRKFFLVTGALPLAAATALLFFPPDSTKSAANAVYIALMLGLFFIAFTYYVAPYLALLPELSPERGGRVFISAAIAAFSLLGAALVMIGIPLLQEIFAPLGASAALKISICIASLAALVSLISGAAPIDEKRFGESKPAETGFLESLKMTLSNKTFLIYMLGTILFWFSFNIIRSLIAYYPIVLLQKEQSFQTVLMALLFGSAFLCFIIINIISKHITNKILMLAGLLSFSLFMSLTYFIDMFGDYRVYAACAHMILLGIPVSILLVIPNAIVSNISSMDGLKTGIRREAMFFGVQGFFMKINYGVAAAAASYLFAVFGKDAANPMGVKMAGPTGGIFALIGFVVFLFYPQKDE
ncbi:MAG: MFS transporter [Spirochaetia bacterium]|jgi:GPH family glycoside/pentoside/hexuronide:cation symporter|nr:MFS transporter [Spirochaetia bacterium]